MIVLLISGSFPPEHCGIGDYTANLSAALKQEKIDVEILANIKWSLTNIGFINKQIKKADADIIHIQYPSVGYGMSIVPQIISLYYNTIVTIHEVSQSHWVRKLSLMPFSFRSKLIFTNVFELESYRQLFPWIKGSASVIPIGSNIKSVSQASAADKSIENIVYFGQIRPQKGLEDVIALAKIIERDKLRFKVIIVGQLIDKFNPYYEKIKALSDPLSIIEWKINLPENEVSGILDKNLIAFLPFPDGVSARRGSMLAALQNNMLVFTTKGRQTTSDIERALCIIHSTADLAKIIAVNTDVDWQNLLNEKKPYIDELVKKTDWKEIAKNHEALYNSLSIDTVK